MLETKKIIEYHKIYTKRKYNILLEMLLVVLTDTQ